MAASGFLAFGCPVNYSIPSVEYSTATFFSPRYALPIGGESMTIQANIALSRSDFVAELSDGRRLVKPNLRDMAAALHDAGVMARGTLCEHRADHRILTAGQLVALKAEMRRLELLPVPVSAPKPSKPRIALVA